MSLFAKLFNRRRDPRDDLVPLWHRTVEIARQEHWYAECGVADTVEGRFDMVTMVLALVLLRMEREPSLVPPSVLLTELFVRDMDGQLRESGVGDVVVGKHVGKLMSTLGGRLGALRKADEEAALVAAVDRNVSLLPEGSSLCVGRALGNLRKTLDATADEALLRGEIAA